MTATVIVSRYVVEVLSSSLENTQPPTPSGGCCNTIRVNMTATATLGCRLTNIPRPRVAFEARAVTVGRLTNA